MADQSQQCINCGSELIRQGSVLWCPSCNSEVLDHAHVFLNDDDSSEFVFIECPGATLHDPDTNEVIEGVRFLETDQTAVGYEIVGKRIYAPTHRRYRRIRREALGRVRRCEGCQDYTIRMRRKEGRDFYIPSHKHPRRNKLRGMTHTNRP